MKRIKQPISSTAESSLQTISLAEIELMDKLQLLDLIRKLHDEMEAVAPGDINDQLSHDLQVHQIELEMQNRELREAQHDIELARDRYADLYDFSPVSFITFDDKGIIKNINLVGSGLLGKARSYVIGHAFTSWICRDDVAKFYKHLKSVLQGNDRKVDELQLISNANGSVYARIESVRSRNRETDSFVCQSAIIDITNEKIAQQKISLQSRQLELITDSLPALVAYINVNEVHVFANKAYLDWFNLPKSRVLNKKLNEIWHEKDYFSISNYLIASFRGKLVSFDIELSSDTSDKKYVNVTFIPDFDSTNRLHGLIVMINDISQRLTNEMLDRKRLLETAHISRLCTMGEMASEIAHELNQPLAAISIYSGACQRLIDSDKANPEDVVNTLNDIKEQAERAGEVIKHIREFASKNDLQMAQLCLNDLVDEAMALLKVELRSHNIDLVKDLAVELPLVLLDRILIEQVILNVSRNAIEAMEATDINDRVLTISTRTCVPSQIELVITDTGPGLSVTQLKDVFEAFHTTKHTGMGLGLSISKSIIDAHQGRIWAVSNKSSGSAFFITLPIYTDEGSHNEHNRN